MLFRFTYTKAYTSDQITLIAKRAAKRKIIFYKQHAAEKALDKYLRKTYKASLTTACLKILANASFSDNGSHEIFITLPDKVLDNVATIITFGTGSIPGSNILRNAFSF